MRKPEYLSPTSLQTFEKNPEEYYLRYLADCKPPKLPQTVPMSIGSAFDAYTKSYLYKTIYGENHNPKYDLQSLFEAQVESQNRDYAWEHGKYVFDMYVESGSLADLMTELKSAVSDPQFEVDVKGQISGYREGINKTKMAVPLFGKPDLKFMSAEAASVTYDWKVNGYCGQYNTSPMPGYLMLREQKENGPWYRKGAHKNCIPTRYKGITINGYGCLDSYSSDWALQLATYAWLFGEEVGADIITGIDQIVGNGSKKILDKPTLRVASHRSRISQKFQFEAMHRYQVLWGILTESDEKFYFFRDLSFEDSKAKCALLEKQAASLTDPTLSADEQWILAQGRTQ